LAAHDETVGTTQIFWVWRVKGQATAKTTATAKSTADPYGMTTKKSKSKR
jgi:hypothetical protein